LSKSKSDKSNTPFIRRFLAQQLGYVTKFRGYEQISNKQQGSAFAMDN
jgi:hypothetical protein